MSERTRQGAGRDDTATAPARRPGELRTWRYGDIAVRYREELDGGGTRLTPAFVDCVARHSVKPVYDHALEWCAGPGFIGFALLAAGLCRRLTLCDINPAASACAALTARAHGLTDRVSQATGPDLAPLDPAARFDLVVANPPNFVALNPRHPTTRRLTDDDLRPRDPQWRAHRAFYGGIARFLTPDARLFISEVNPSDSLVFIPPEESEPYDVRARPAAEDFRRMIRDGGLRLLGTHPYFTGRDGARLEMMISEPVR
ncbi:methyltransferase [Actinomadura sp. 3N508]|uniref:methyltransferase n=1 Tax=Actinomadura sp. 3N508 TaxID=3375153 RepID=UPI0037B6340C